MQENSLTFGFISNTGQTSRLKVENRQPVMIIIILNTSTRNTNLRKRRGRDMRGDHDVRMAPEGAGRGKRLCGEHIQYGTTQPDQAKDNVLGLLSSLCSVGSFSISVKFLPRLSAIEGSEKRVLVDHRASSHIYEHGGPLPGYALLKCGRVLRACVCC